MPQPILIIGAGVGGLALAHGLKAHSIPFHIFERDPASSARAQGYRFRIHPAGAESLASVLPPAVFSRFEASCAAVPASMARLDALTGMPPPPPPPPAAPNGQPATHRPPPPPQATDPRFNKSYNADRTAFRALLLDEIGEANVSFGKRCVGMKQKGEEAMIEFEDGTSAKGSLVVGADGVGSFVRKYYFSQEVKKDGKGEINGVSVGIDLEPIDTGARCIYGKTPLTPDLVDSLPPQMRDSTMLIQDRSNNAGVITLFTDPMRFERDGTTGEAGTSTSTTNTTNDPTPITSNHPLPPPPADYLYWVLGARLSLFRGHSDQSLLDPANPLSHGMGSAALSLEITATWAPAVRAALQAQDGSQTAVLRMLTSVPKKLSAFGASSVATAEVGSDGRSRVVTLLGDAAHVMPPAGGNGANTAIRDAAVLVRVLVEEGWGGLGEGDGEGAEDEGGKEGQMAARVVRKYEQVMTGYAAQVVGAAQKGGAWIFDQPAFEE